MITLVRRQNKWALVDQGSLKTVSGLPINPSAEKISVEAARDLGLQFHDFQRKDLDYLMWQDWDQILRFSFIPEVVTYIINPMRSRGTHQNLWREFSQ